MGVCVALPSRYVCSMSRACTLIVPTLVSRRNWRLLAVYFNEWKTNLLNLHMFVAFPLIVLSVAVMCGKLSFCTNDEYTL